MRYLPWRLCGHDYRTPFLKACGMPSMILEHGFARTIAWRNALALTGHKKSGNSESGCWLSANRLAIQLERRAVRGTAIFF